MCEKCDCLCVRSICLCAQDYYLYVKSVWFCSFNSSLCVRLTYTCVIFSCLCVRLSQPCVDFSYSCSAVLCFLALRLTDGTICSWGLRVAFLSNPTEFVAGCGLCCPHRNPNCYIVFVRHSNYFFIL